MTNTLIGVLSRFRLERVAFMCDVKEMFHQFRVNEEHRDYLRFLWWPNGEYQHPVQHCRMKVHLFGAASSPGCANYGLKKIASDNADKFGHDVARFIHNNFYVDDGLLSVPTSAEAIDMIARTKKTCNAGKLHLHKFVSNSREVMQAVPVTDRAKAVKELNLLHDDLPIERALGLQWCIESDTFGFRVTFADKPCTRRGLLSTVMSLYDPLGLIAPVTLKGKQIIQDLCREGACWDDPLTDELQMRWERWRQDIISLENISVRRCFKPEEFEEVKSAQFHHFSDASTGGYGNCSYLRLEDVRGSVHCSLVIGKARVTPLKRVTIPRLELTAAVVSSTISSFLEEELGTLQAEHLFWTDSNVVLGYISNDEKRFHVFVANRIRQIRNHSSPDQWNYVNSKDNPADIASRGATVEQLMASDWFDGPKFLSDAKLPEPESVYHEISEDDPEVKRSHVATTQTKPSSFDLERFNRFSSWHQLKRAVANCERYKTQLRRRCEEKSSTTTERVISPRPLTVDDLQKAQTEIIKHVQEQWFDEEIQILRNLSSDRDPCRDERDHRRRVKRSSRLHKLDPFIDENGLLRVGGRLCRAEGSFEVKHPVILPQKGHVTDLIIRHCHQQTAHQGRGITVNQLRLNGFWVIGCSTVVSRLIRKCVICNKLRGVTQSQKMSDLPKDRVEPAPPFTYSGMDCFGPWVIREGRKELKRYGLLFTCMASRAVHIETLNSLSTDAFINALRRFLSTRGPVRQLRSDRGTNFIGAEAEFKRWAQTNHEKVKDFLMREGCDFINFNFNVPSASHMGGSWERQIRSIRQALDGLMHQAGHQLDDESLRTFMCEAAAIVNGRPLTVDNLYDPGYPEPITPNHLLTMKTRVLLPPPGHFVREDLYSRKRWRRVQHLLNEFWCRWKKEFLQNLQSRQKWVHPKREAQVGDIVIVKDENTPRNRWLLGRITETFPSEDGLVRKVKLVIADAKLNRTGKRTQAMQTLERPIHKLVTLLAQEDQEEFPTKEP
ncbi:uncharacterized protein [Diadema antillarum]|uniref:uncharacterized protein n=1 Tax=Diadema antillarum TaxID=105358 RepID=UPI003A88C730